MSTSLQSRLAAACGAAFAVALLAVTAGNEDSLSVARGAIAVGALTLALVFVTYVAALLGRADAGWPAPVALATGAAGLVLKISSIGPELAIRRAHIADGTPLHDALQQMADGLTVMSLLPLGVFCAATALAALRTGALPRWLAASTAIVALALLVNGLLLTASFVPALLLFVLWSFVASVVLVLRASQSAATVAGAQPAPA